MYSWIMPKNKKKARSQPKQLYRVRNWSDYDAALVNRGSLTIWISEDAISKWKAEKEPNKRGRQREYRMELKSLKRSDVKMQAFYLSGTYAKMSSNPSIRRRAIIYRNRMSRVQAPSVIHRISILDDIFFLVFIVSIIPSKYRGGRS